MKLPGLRKRHRHAVTGILKYIARCTAIQRPPNMMTCDKIDGLLQATCSCGTGWLQRTRPPRGSSSLTSCRRRPCRKQWSHRPQHKRCPSCVVGVVSGVMAASDQMLKQGRLCHHMAV